MIVDVSRPGIWGNPYRAGRDGTRGQVIEKYERYVRLAAERGLLRLSELKDAELMCACGSGRRKKGDKNCHRFVLYKLVDEL